MNGKLLKALVIPASASTCLLPIAMLGSCANYQAVCVKTYPVSVERSYIYYFPDWTEDGKLDPDSKYEVDLGSISISNGADKDHTCHTRVSTKREIPPGIRVEGGGCGIGVYGDWQHFNAAVARQPIEIYMEYNTDGVPWLAPTHGWVEWPEPLIIPAYDGSVAIRSDQDTDWHYLPWGISDASELLRQKFDLNYPEDKICLGIWRIDKHPQGQHEVWNNDYAKSRVIPISSFDYLEPVNPRFKVEAINDNAFNLEVDNDMDHNDPDWGRTAACETFRNYFFGSQEHPDWGFWKEIRFEGYVTPLEKIGDHAFYHCWSLEASLATYYGAQEAHNMVYNGTHS